MTEYEKLERMRKYRDPMHVSMTVPLRCSRDSSEYCLLLIPEDPLRNVPDILAGFDRNDTAWILNQRSRFFATSNGLVHTWVNPQNASDQALFVDIWCWPARYTGRREITVVDAHGRPQNRLMKPWQMFFSFCNFGASVSGGVGLWGFLSVNQLRALYHTGVPDSAYPSRTSQKSTLPTKKSIAGRAVAKTIRTPPAQNLPDRTDMYMRKAAEIFGVAPSEVTREQRNAFEQQRYAFKQQLFCTVYGRSLLPSAVRNPPLQNLPIPKKVLTEAVEELRKAVEERIHGYAKDLMEAPQCCVDIEKHLLPPVLREGLEIGRFSNEKGDDLGPAKIKYGFLEKYVKSVQKAIERQYDEALINFLADIEKGR